MSFVRPLASFLPSFLPSLREPVCALCEIVRNSIEILDCFIVNSDNITVQTRSEGLRVVQLLELDVSGLGFLLPFFGELGVLRCLDNVPRGVLQVWSAAAPGAGSEGTGCQTTVV